MNGLTPPLGSIAARLANLPGMPQQGDAPTLPDASTTIDNGADWRSVPVPAALNALFERAASAAPLAARPFSAGQIHLVSALPGLACVLLDSWNAPRQAWRGWIVTPDPAYAGAADLVVEQRDAPIDARAALVLCDWAVELAPSQLGACVGLFSQERLHAVRWLARHGGENPAPPRPGVIARRAVPDRAGAAALDGYALTGTPFAAQDARLAYRALIAQGLRHAGVADAAPAGAVAANVALNAATPAAAKQAANAPRWLKTFAALAASVAVLQFGWLLSMQGQPDNAGQLARNGDAPVYRGNAQAARNVRVLFRADASEAELRTWLQAQELEIVSGPDALGAYTLRLHDAAQVLPAPAPDNPLAKVNP